MLDKWLANQILMEEKTVDKVIVIFPGRFQPFGRHHAEVFKWVQKKFGKNNSYIATSNKVELPKSPFSFDDKKKIINKYGFKNVVQVKNPYMATEITSKFDPETTAVVFVVGGKEDGRIKPGKYFREWKGKAEHGLGEHGYFIDSPVITQIKVPGHGVMSGTTIRKALGNPVLDDDERMDLFKGVFGHTDKTIYKLVTDKLLKLNEEMIQFVLRNKLYEATGTLAGGQEVDDGPRSWWGNETSFRKYNEELAKRMGLDVLNYLTGHEIQYTYDEYNTDYPNGPVEAVSYFPAGDVDSVGAGTQYIELKGNPAYEAWEKHIEQVALRLGYTFVHDMKSKDLAIKHSKNEPTTEEAMVIDLEDQDLEGMLDEGKIVENPDVVYNANLSKQLASYPDQDARPFGYLFDKMMVGGRNDFVFPGRMWVRKKIISFWKYPPKGKFKKLIKDLEKESGVKIWSKGWQVEIYPGKKQIDNSNNKSVLVPLEKYNGSKLPPGGDIDHVKSPMLKKKKTGIKPNVGSKKKPKGSKKGEVPAQTHARMRMDWWNPEDDLVEGPDIVYKGAKKLYYSDDQARSFFRKFGKFLVGYPGKGHSELISKYGGGGRSFDGRVWLKDKVISFWIFPKQSQLKKFIKELEIELRVKIWNSGWMIEVSSDDKGNIDIGRTENERMGAQYPVLIPLEDYTDKRSMEFDRTEHMASPMLKKKMGVPKGVGSKKTPKGGSKSEIPVKTHAKMRMDHIEPKDILKEDPDTIHLPTKNVNYRDKQTVPFAVLINGDIISGHYGEGHMQLTDRIGIDYSDMVLKGRIWTKVKIVNFWKYPEQSKLKKIIKDVEKQTNLKVWNNKYKIEVNADDDGHIDLKKIVGKNTYALPEHSVFIPLEDYSGSPKMEFDPTLHLASPMLKKKMGVPKGVGSKKKPKGWKKGEVPAQTHARMKQEVIEIDESISIDVEIGDTILTGRFKNSPVVVKEIGKDKYGMPTINGRKVVTFKMGKKRPNIFDEKLFSTDWWTVIVEDFLSENNTQ